jgi:hypothetical protein
MIPFSLGQSHHMRLEQVEQVTVERIITAWPDEFKGALGFYFASS